MTDLTFRAWDKVNKEWLLTKSSGLTRNFKTNKMEYKYSNIFTLHNFDTCRTIGAFPANYEITQSSGLKDMNGNLIFEGDILKTNNTGDIVLHQVEYSDGSFSSVSDFYDELLSNLAFYALVCGNKFENPDLCGAI